jgi:hypothetical protein
VLTVCADIYITPGSFWVFTSRRKRKSRPCACAEIVGKTRTQSSRHPMFLPAGAIAQRRPAFSASKNADTAQPKKSRSEECAIISRHRTRGGGHDATETTPQSPSAAVFILARLLSSAPPIGWVYGPYTICADPPRCSMGMVNAQADRLNVRAAPNRYPVMSLVNGVPFSPLGREGTGCSWLRAAILRPHSRGHGRQAFLSIGAGCTSNQKKPTAAQFSRFSVALASR